ncbi:class F sortase [Microbacterium sp.]|uniref:class F sortase n=1 Tax=Microbacterium sp. TaxID=51671 RepID=UPI0025DE444F|nr:class F sortase [Microbacterium sp.]
MTRITRAAAAALLMLVLTGCSLPAPSGGSGQPAPSLTPMSPTPDPAPTAAVDVPIVSSAPTTAPAAQVPTRVRVDAAAIDMPVVPVGVQSDGQMELPVEPSVAGWYRFGPDPGSTAGRVVMAAHVDSRVYGLGPLARLRDVAPGTEIVVDVSGGEPVRYAVQSITYYPRSALPTDILFARTGEAALVLITCGGSFDPVNRSYSDNVVAVATRVS